MQRALREIVRRCCYWCETQKKASADYMETSLLPIDLKTQMYHFHLSLGDCFASILDVTKGSVIQRQEEPGIAVPFDVAEEVPSCKER